MPRATRPVVGLVAAGVALAGAVAAAFIFRQLGAVPHAQTPPLATTSPDAVPAPLPMGVLRGWNTYRNDAYGVSFRYPPQVPPPYDYQEGPGPSVVAVGGIGIQYVSPESNRVAGYTLPQFTRIPWLHQADDPYTEITVGGARAALYDLIVPSYPRGEEEPVRGYTRTLQVGLETPRGGFLVLSADSALLPDEAAARNTDLSWFYAVLSTVLFL